MGKFIKHDERVKNVELDKVIRDFDDVIADTLDVIPVSLSDIISNMSSNKETDTENAALMIKIIRLLDLYKRSLNDCVDYIIKQDKETREYREEVDKKLNQILELLKEQDGKEAKKSVMKIEKKETNE